MRVSSYRGVCNQGSAYRGLPTGGVCIQGGLPLGDLLPGGFAHRGGLPNPPELEEWAVHNLLECFLVNRNVFIARHSVFLVTISLLNFITIL